MKILPILPCIFLFATVPARTAEPAQFDVGPYQFNKPADWKSVPVTSPMRKAQLAVPNPAPGAAAAEVTFFSFGSGAGGVDANVQRWVKQFDAPAGAEKVEKKDVAGTKVTFVATEGTFASGMPGGPATPMANYALRGAIIEAPNELIFVKMTGPAEVVKGAAPAFAEMVEKALAAKRK